ncbi:MAG: hypothetical protein JSV66_18100 [Trueperaceae bacterium]|nr:MAG: hypothetical protein JSV66_18100 [Trueperaceae bacterium]
MLTTEAIRTVQEVIAPQRDPVLSLYLDVNPAHAENARGAPLIRAKEAIKALGVPKPFTEAFLKGLTHHHGIPQARTLVSFASEDLNAFFVNYPLQLELPLLTSGGVIARWGPPYVLPLLQVLDAQERHGVVYVDRARWRYFEVFFGDIEEKQDAFRPLDPSTWRRLSDSKPAAHGIPARGGSGKDRFEQRKEAWTRRFYRDAAKLLEQAVKAHGIDHLFMMGLKPQVQTFIGSLSEELKGAVVATLPPPANPAAPAREILDLLKPHLERLQCQQDQKLLQDISERGVKGLSETLEALQADRLQIVAAPWKLDLTVYRCSESGYLSATPSSASQLCPDQHHRPVPLQEILPELVASHGAKLTFLNSESAVESISSSGGLAGLARWY